MPTFRCRECGSCCRTLIDAYNGEVSSADLARWQKAGRLDILARIDSRDYGHGNIVHYAWIDPESGDDVDLCPWLIPSGSGGWRCAIHTLKPDHCRAFPENPAHAAATGCPGWPRE